VIASVCIGFFFQAEDGIRDATVTGVQTCALPIYLLSGGRLFVDVGSHVGTWTVRASRVFDKVVAFEPTVETVRVLEKNLNLNSEIGRASCRERGEVWGGGVSIEEETLEEESDTGW